MDYLNNEVLTPQEANAAIEKAHSISSSASEIDRVAAFNKDAINALAQAKNRRIDLMMLGDSNQLKDGFGFAGAFNQILGERFGIYATGIGSSPTSSDWRLYNTIPLMTTTGATEYETVYPANSPEPYSYLASGTALPITNGVEITATSLIGIKNELKFWTCWGGFASGDGSFRRMIRHNVSPYTALASDPAIISTNTGAIGKNFTSLTLPADVSRLEQTLEFKVSQAGVTGATIKAPFIEFYSRVENPNLKKGISVHTLHGVGGDSLYDFALKINSYTDVAIKNFFEEQRRLQLSVKQKPIVVVYINSGLNDRNETVTSLGWRADSIGSSKEAYQDNLEVIVNRLKNIYAASWDVEELFFLICPSHPVSTPDDNVLVGYRTKAKETAFREYRTSYIHIPSIVTSDYLLANGYYLSNGTDRNHLNTAGYLDIVGKIVDLVPDIE